MLSTLLFSVVLSFSPAARAESWVVLLQAENEVDADLKRNVQVSAKASLKKRNHRNKWISPPEASLEDVVLALGCKGWDEKCAGSVAKMMGATRALVVELEPSGDDVKALLWVVNNRGRKLRSTAGLLKKEHLKEELSFFIRAWVGRKIATRLVLKSEPAGAVVKVNGQELGVTPLVLEYQIKPGQALVEMKMSGFVSVKHSVDVRNGGQVVLKLQLVSSEKESKLMPIALYPSKEENVGNEAAGKENSVDENIKESMKDADRMPSLNEIKPMAEKDEFRVLTFSGMAVAATGAVVMGGGVLGYLRLFIAQQEECRTNENACIARIKAGEVQQSDYIERVNQLNRDLEALRWVVIAVEIAGASLLMTGIVAAGVGFIIEE